MNRQEKIDVIIDFLDENGLKIIETSTIQGLIIDAEYCIDEPEAKDEIAELISTGLSLDELELFKTYLNDNQMILIKEDEISGVSFENCEYISDLLHESELLNDEENAEEDEEE